MAIRSMICVIISGRNHSLTNPNKQAYKMKVVSVAKYVAQEQYVATKMHSFDSFLQRLIKIERFLHD